MHHRSDNIIDWPGCIIYCLLHTDLEYCTCSDAVQGCCAGAEVSSAEHGAWWVETEPCSRAAASVTRWRHATPCTGTTADTAAADCSYRWTGESDDCYYWLLVQVNRWVWRLLLLTACTGEPSVTDYGGGMIACCTARPVVHCCMHLAVYG